jgi:hypothetical protein
MSPPFHETKFLAVTSAYDAETWWSVSEDRAEPELDSMPLHEKGCVQSMDLTANKLVE